MSANRIRNSEGVILDYGDPGEKHPYHSDQSPKLPDLPRLAVIRAERELVALITLLEHVQLSDIARIRLDEAFRSIDLALRLERRKVGLEPRFRAC